MWTTRRLGAIHAPLKHTGQPALAFSFPTFCLLGSTVCSILCICQVNLLDDGLVDVVLDRAASGINTVEREGVSIVHPAKFIMIGSGNPAVSE